MHNWNPECGLSQTVNNEDPSLGRAAPERDPFTGVAFLAGAIPDRRCWRA
jgi:hypothetical protein